MGRRVTSGSASPLAGRSRIYLAFVALFAVLGVTGAAMAAAPQEGGSRTVIAEFVNVGPITNQSVIRIGGTDVGVTGQPTVDPDRRLAILPLELEAKAFPLYKNATARVDQLSLIGERYVEITPGTPEAGVLEPGEPIRVQQTSLANDYQNLVQALNDPAAAGLSSVVRNLGQGIAGRGQNVAQILERAGPALTQTDQLLASVNRQNGILGQVVDQVQPLINGLADDRGRTLDRTVGSATNLLATTAVNEQNLQATLRELPDTLAAAQRTLGTLTGTAREGEATLRALRPVTDNLPAISRELQGFTDAANPALQALNPFLDDTSRLLDEARPLAAELKRTGQPLYDTVHRARPVTTSVTENIGGPYGKGPDNLNCRAGVSAAQAREACLDPRVQGVLGFIHNFALTTNRADGVGHYARLYTVLDIPQATFTGTTNEPCAFRGPGSQVFGCKPDKKGWGDNNHQAAQASASMDAISQVLPGANNTITRGDPAPGGSATGLTPDQEQDALGTLMGGN